MIFGEVSHQEALCHSFVSDQGSYQNTAAPFQVIYGDEIGSLAERDKSTKINAYMTNSKISVIFEKVLFCRPYGKVDDSVCTRARLFDSLWKCIGVRLSKTRVHVWLSKKNTMIIIL